MTSSGNDKCFFRFQRSKKKKKFESKSGRDQEEEWIHKKFFNT